MDHRAHTVKPANPPAAPNSPPPPRASGVTYVGLAVLAVAELAWLAWFLIVPLPNANNVGTPGARAVRRGWLLLKTFPEVVPETPFRRVVSGKRPQGAEPHRKPAPAVADPAGRRLDRRGGDRPWGHGAPRPEAGSRPGRRRANRARLWSGRGTARRRHPAVGATGMARSVVVPSGLGLLAVVGPGDFPALACGPVQARVHRRTYWDS